MSEQTQTPGILAGFSVGEEMASHNGVICYPAMDNNSEDKYIVKKISVPDSPVSLAALLLSGAYTSREDALSYYQDRAEDILKECRILTELSSLEGFVPYTAWEITQKEDESGYDVTLISKYRNSLEQILQEQILTHRQIMDLAMDLCNALAACRRAGYLYVDLKPGNVFYTEDMDHRIGDLGFIPLSSLRFASLPEKYRSAYTPPEIEDALSQLNTTVDVYALGLILYQAYNGGTFATDGPRPVLPLMPPLYADYEMAEIILTACHPDLSRRYADPSQLGQALVQYMQRNGVPEGSIVPPPVVTPELDAGEDFLPEQETADQEDCSDIPELEFMQELVNDDTAPSEESTSGLEHTAISDETSQILAQADELICHELPEPVIQPEPIDVPMPPPIVDIPAEETQPESPAAESPMENPEPEQEEIPVEETPIAVPAPEPEPDPQPQPPAPAPAKQKPAKEYKPLDPRRSRIIRAIVGIVAMCLLAGIAFWVYTYYQETYIQIVDEMSITGTADSITVHIVTDAEESQLQITCSDTYGNTFSSKVTDGTAHFTGLSPQTRYTIRVCSTGGFKLTGAITDTFTTAGRTVVENFTATIGPSDGSVYLNFQISGTDCDQWILTWSASGIASQSATFSGHSYTVTDLQIGLVYTFTLSAEDGSNVVGETQTMYTPRPIIRAQNVSVVSYGSGKLTITWSAPDGESVSEWTVRCSDGSGYDQTVTVSQCSVTFTGLSHESDCTVEITAQGMTQSVLTTFVANPINITSFTSIPDGWGNVEFYWYFTGTEPEGGWTVTWSCDGSPEQTLTTQQPRALLPLIPGGNYTIVLFCEDNRIILGQTLHYTAPEADTFRGYGISAEALRASLCIVNDPSNWTAADIAPDAIRTLFAPGEYAGLILSCDPQPEASADTVLLTFVIRGPDGQIHCLSTTQAIWDELWADAVCALNIPQMPDQPGDYSLLVCCNGQILANLDFTVE